MKRGSFQNTPYLTQNPRAVQNTGAELSAGYARNPSFNMLLPGIMKRGIKRGRGLELIALPGRSHDDARYPHADSPKTNPIFRLQRKRQITLQLPTTCGSAPLLLRPPVFPRHLLHTCLRLRAEAVHESQARPGIAANPSQISA